MSQAGKGNVNKWNTLPKSKSRMTNDSDDITCTETELNIGMNGVSSKEDRITLAELEMYSDIYYSNNPGHFNTEDLGDCTKEALNYYKKTEAFDNNAYILDQIVDERIIKNHQEWVQEVTPWAGTASMAGSIDFNPGDYINFQGLRRPRGVQQVNPWQITEITADDLSENKPFII